MVSLTCRFSRYDIFLVNSSNISFHLNRFVSVYVIGNLLSLPLLLSVHNTCANVYCNTAAI